MKRFFKEVYIKGHGKEDKNTFNTFKDTKFYKVNADKFHKELKDCDNLQYITFEDIKR